MIDQNVRQNKNTIIYPFTNNRPSDRVRLRSLKLCDNFRVDCAIRQDYYAINYAIFSGLIYIVLPGFKGEKPLVFNVV